MPDRIGFHIEVPPVDFKELSSQTTSGEKSSVNRERLKVVRTLADLGGSVNIRSNDILGAIRYRAMDRKLSIPGKSSDLIGCIHSTCRLRGVDSSGPSRGGNPRLRILLRTARPRRVHPRR
ncbi:MAG: hypothetical protein EOP87_20560 [Verrucomicrobiaceae bacterium]|nr:MAG: hypothetical protein EOP87_20560 [Verrucomicrobiaceae bacterium]